MNIMRVLEDRVSTQIKKSPKTDYSHQTAMSYQMKAHALGKDLFISNLFFLSLIFFLKIRRFNKRWSLWWQSALASLFLLSSFLGLKQSFELRGLSGQCLYQRHLDYMKQWGSAHMTRTAACPYPSFLPGQRTMLAKILCKYFNIQGHGL